jgi:hypothetical protein
VDTPPDGNCLLHNQAVAELDEQRTFVMRRALANTHGLDPTHQAVIFGKLAWCALMPGAHDGDTCPPDLETTWTSSFAAWPWATPPRLRSGRARIEELPLHNMADVMRAASAARPRRTSPSDSPCR